MTDVKKEGKPKKKIGERASSILTETSGNTIDSSQTMSNKEDDLNTKGDRPMAGETMWNQGAKWQEMMMGVFNNAPTFTSSNKAIEPLIELTKLQQQSFMNMTRVWMDQLGKIGEASRSGDAKKVLETCMESNKEIFRTCQESMKEQATARYEFLRTFIPAMPGFTGDRT